jgi:hypothetical protein
MTAYVTRVPSKLQQRPAPRGPRAALIWLERWYDRQAERRRLALGVLLILVLASACLYVLAAASTILVNQLEPFAPDELVAPTAPPLATSVLPQAAVEALQPEPTLTPKPTPPVDEAGELIAPPPVTEVPLVWSPPRYDAPPVQSYRPRAVENSPPLPTVAPTTAPGRAATAPAGPNGPAGPAGAATPSHSGTALPGASTPVVRTPAPVGTTQPGLAPTSTPIRQAPAIVTPLPTRPPAVATPVVPTLPPLRRP